MLQDVSSDVFVSMRGAESLVMGIATSDGAASMVDTAIGSVCFMPIHMIDGPSHPQSRNLVVGARQYAHCSSSPLVRSCVFDRRTDTLNTVISCAAAMQPLSGGSPLQAVVDDAGVGHRRAGPDPGDAVLAAGAQRGRAVRDHAAAYRPGHVPWHLATTRVRLGPFSGAQAGRSTGDVHAHQMSSCCRARGHSDVVVEAQWQQRGTLLGLHPSDPKLGLGYNAVTR